MAVRSQNFTTTELYPVADIEALALGRLEKLPKWLNLIPMVAQWLWLSLIYRSVTLPSCANPAITTGGMVGEGKLEYFASMGSHASVYTARTTSIQKTAATDLKDACAVMGSADLVYPLIAKPDIGWCGFGVRLIRDDAEMLAYINAFPNDATIVLQDYISDEGEAGLFYMRDPDAESGSLIGVLLRFYPRVVGDGIRTIGDLIADDGRLSRLGRDGLSQPCCDPSLIPAAGEIIRVATIGSTRVGGLYRDATSLITPELNAAVHAIARDMADFHIGRFDVRYQSLSALREGRGFTIIEVNGAGSEAVHAWDPSFSLWHAYKIIFAKQKALFALSAKMRERGHKPVGVYELSRLYLKQQRLIAQYPPSN